MASLGLWYVRERWLQSSGRWHSVDPVPTEPAYQYVRNMPTMAVDPTGSRFAAATCFSMYNDCLAAVRQWATARDLLCKIAGFLSVSLVGITLYALAGLVVAIPSITIPGLGTIGGAALAAWLTWLSLVVGPVVGYAVYGACHRAWVAPGETALSDFCGLWYQACMLTCPDPALCTAVRDWKDATWPLAVGRGSAALPPGTASFGFGVNAGGKVTRSPE